MWLSIAAKNGGMVTPYNLNGVANEMTPSQIEKAQNLAREYVKKNYKGC